MSEVNVDDRLPQVMTGHIQTAAYAGECRLCPPPLFLILVSFLQIGFFVHQVMKLAWFNWSLLHRAHSTGSSFESISNWFHF